MDRPDSALSRSFSALVFLVAIGFVIATLIWSVSPDWIAVAVFTALLAFADASEVELPGGSNANASAMPFTAAIVVFLASGALGGLLLACLLAGLMYLPEWRAHKWAKLAFNSGTLVVCGATAFWVVRSLPSSWLDSPLGTLVIAVVAGATSLVVNIALVVLVDYLADGRRPHDVARELLPLVAQLMPFALLGGFAGRLFIDVGPIMVPLFVVPILMARQAFASYLELKNTQEAATNTLIRALESKDAYTAGHVERVAVYAEYIGRELQFTPGRLERLRLAALMHDIGKLIVPNELLNKPGKLTEEEFAVVRHHERVSMDLLREIDFLAPVAPAASSEHTHYRPDDPKHPIEPYIVHVADAYDAMTSTRSYRKALSQGVAFAELREKAGTQFHPVAVEALISAINARGEEHGKGHEDEQHLWAVPPPEAGTGSAGLGDLAGEEGSS